MKLNAPLFAITALVMLIALSVGSPPDDSVPNQHAALRICGVLAIALFVTALLTGGASFLAMVSAWFMTSGAKSILSTLPAKLFYWPFVIKPFVCVAFCIAMAAVTYLSRKQSGGHTPARG